MYKKTANDQYIDTSHCTHDLEIEKFVSRFGISNRALSLKYDLSCSGLNFSFVFFFLLYLRLREDSHFILGAQLPSV